MDIGNVLGGGKLVNQGENCARHRLELQQLVAALLYRHVGSHSIRRVIGCLPGVRPQPQNHSVAGCQSDIMHEAYGLSVREIES